MNQPNVKTQSDTANSANKLLQPFLDRAEKWRFGQRLVAGTALVSVAAALVFGVSDPRYTAAAVFLVMGISFLTKERRFLTARHIAVKDSAGRFRAVMTGEGDEPMIGLLDGSGKVRLQCGLDKAGVPTISLMDPTGKPRLYLMAPRAAAVNLVDGRGQPRIHVSIPGNKGGAIGLVGENGQPLVLVAEEEGRTFITGKNRSGEVQWALP